MIKDTKKLDLRNITLYSQEITFVKDFFVILDEVIEMEFKQDV